MGIWLTSAEHERWLRHHGLALLAFGRRTTEGLPAGGGAWLRDDGTPDLSRPLLTWLTSRTVHVYGLGALLGVPGCAAIAEAALRGLTGPLRDTEHGGWFSSVGSDGPEADKSCYAHAFVLLAGATGAQAGVTGARALLDDAAAVFLDRFWDGAAGLCIDTWSTDFAVADPYRGLNANMHAVEAMLSVASLTGDGDWLARAHSVSRFVVGQAAANGWRIPEHFDESWTPMPEYNADQPAHQFKPYGATVGHALEWARLLIHLANALGPAERDELVDASVSLFDQAVADGWAPDGAPGFVYTTDWHGAPVVADRLHWVLAEGINTAACLYRQTGEERFAAAYQQWWDHAATYHLDHRHGSWIHQLASTNRPAASVWSGKPDLYHAFQTTLVPRLPLYPMMAAALDRPGTAR